AFILVCAGVLYMDYSGLSTKSKFRVPYINGKYIIGLAFVGAWILLYYYGQDIITEWKEAPLVDIIEHKSLTLVFWLVWLILAVMGYKHNFSLLPATGILVNLYLMGQLGASNWIIFLLWLAIGLVLYFIYVYKHSKLNKGTDN